MATRTAQLHSRPHHVPSDVGAFLRHMDYLLLAVVGGAIAYGLWVLSAVTRDDVPGDPDYYVVRQGIYVAAGSVALLVAMTINPEVWRRLRIALFVATVASIVAVFVVGDEVRGSKRWIELGFFQLDRKSVV